MRDCANAEVRDQLPEFVHGRLGSTARLAVEAHLATCADCAAEVDLLRSIAGAMGDALAARVPRVDVDRIVAALPAPRRARPVWFRTAQWRAAAVILFMAGSTSLLWVNRKAPSLPSEPLATESMSFAGGVADLSEAQLNALLGEMSKLSSTPSAELDVSTSVSAAAEQSK